MLQRSAGGFLLSGLQGSRFEGLGVYRSGFFLSGLEEVRSVVSRG